MDRPRAGWAWRSREEQGGAGRSREEQGGAGRSREEQGGAGRSREEQGGAGSEGRAVMMAWGGGAQAEGIPLTRTRRLTLQVDKIPVVSRNG